VDQTVSLKGKTELFSMQGNQSSDVRMDGQVGNIYPLCHPLQLNLLPLIANAFPWDYLSGGGRRGLLVTGQPTDATPTCCGISKSNHLLRWRFLRIYTRFARFYSAKNKNSYRMSCLYSKQFSSSVLCDGCESTQRSMNKQTMTAAWKGGRIVQVVGEQVGGSVAWESFTEK